jgi:hypothetical protein
MLTVLVSSLRKCLLLGKSRIALGSSVKWNTSVEVSRKETADRLSAIELGICLGMLLKKKGKNFENLGFNTLSFPTIEAHEFFLLFSIIFC